MLDFFEAAIGINEETLTWWQMAIRAVVVFIAAVVIVRIGNHRVFGKSSAFDIVLGTWCGLFSRGCNRHDMLLGNVSWDRLV